MLILAKRYTNRQDQSRKGFSSTPVKARLQCSVAYTFKNKSAQSKCRGLAFSGNLALNFFHATEDTRGVTPNKALKRRRNTLVRIPFPLLRIGWAWSIKTRGDTMPSGDIADPIQNSRCDREVKYLFHCQYFIFRVVHKIQFYDTSTDTRNSIYVVPEKYMWQHRNNMLTSLLHETCLTWRNSFSL